MSITLEQVANLSMGSLMSRISKKYEGNKKEKNVLYHKKDKFYTQAEEVAADEDKLSIAQNGDIILKTSDPQIATIVNPNGPVMEGTVITSSFIIIKPYSEFVNPEFLVYLLNSQLFKNELKKINEGIIKRIKIADLNKVSLTIPSIKIQNEMVEYLKLVDKEIQLANQLISENENLKEGVIQQYI